MESLVSTEWLQRTGSERPARGRLPLASTRHGRDARVEYLAGHIRAQSSWTWRTGRYRLADRQYPAFSRKFPAGCRHPALGDGSRIVLYDDSAIKTSAYAPCSCSSCSGAHDVAISTADWPVEGRGATLKTGRETLRHAISLPGRNKASCATRPRSSPMLDSRGNWCSMPGRTALHRFRAGEPAGPSIGPYPRLPF